MTASDTDAAPDDVGERAYRLHPKTSVPEMRLLGRPSLSPAALQRTRLETISEKRRYMHARSCRPAHTNPHGCRPPVGSARVVARLLACGFLGNAVHCGMPSPPSAGASGTGGSDTSIGVVGENVGASLYQPDCPILKYPIFRSAQTS
jgi:hypothetical protein